MPAVSKAQQRFFGMVRATQKGEMASPSPEVAKAASSMSKSDVKKFAKTKHDKLPEKKETKESFAIDPKEHRKNQRLAKIRNLAKKGATEGERSAAERKTKGPKMFGEAYYGGEEQRKKDQKKAAYEKQLKRMLPKRAFDQMGREIDPRSGKLKEGWSDKYKKSIDCNNPKGFSQKAHCQGKKKVSESTKYDKYDKEKKQFAKADQRMKFGKFYAKAKETRDRLRPGEVKRYDKKLGRYVSNKD